MAELKTVEENIDTQLIAHFIHLKLREWRTHVDSTEKKIDTLNVEMTEALDDAYKCFFSAKANFTLMNIADQQNLKESKRY